MRSPAAAIGWEFRQRNRVGLIVLSVYVLVMAMIKALIVFAHQPIRLDTPESFALVVVVPLTCTFTYFLAVFSFGLSGDLGARESIYPARLFTLPVTTNALTGWPMLFGSAAMVALWFSSRLFGIWPTDVHVPVVWPALMAAVLLAWTQALTWTPYPLPGLRAVMMVVWLATIDTIMLVAIHVDARESLMLVILAPQIPLAFLAARSAVARARRGDVPDWRVRFAPSALAADRQARTRSFHSAGSAQVWFEWKRHGRSLPMLTAMVLPFELALLFVPGATPGFVWVLLICVLVTPLVLAAFSAASVRQSSPNAGDSHAITPFIAARPMTSRALIAAKLKASMWSTLATWTLVILAVSAALVLSGTASIIAARVGRFSHAVGQPRAAIMMLLALAAFIGFTWKQLVQSMYIGLMGREWLVKARVVGILAFLTALGPVVQWVSEHHGAEEALWNDLPAMLGTLVVLKVCIAAWVALRLQRSRVLGDRALVVGAASWCVAVIALYGVLAWLLYTPFFPRYLLGFAAILVVPLARLSAAPLALEWNRHR